MKTVYVKNKLFFIVIGVIAFLSFPFSGIKANSQTNELNVLYLTLEKASSDTARVRILLDIYELFRRKNTDSALVYAKKAYQLAKSANLYIVEPAQAMGGAYGMVDDYENSTRYAIEAFNEAQKRHDTKSYSIILNTIGSDYLMMKYFDKALEYYNKALQTSEDYTSKFHSLINLGQVNYAMNNFPKAHEYYEKALKMAIEANITTDEAIIYNRMGPLYFEEGNYDRSILYFKKSIKMLSDNDLYFKVDCMKGITENYILTGRYESGIALAKQADSIAKKEGFLYERKYLNAFLSEIYDSLRKPALSLLYYKRFSDIKDSIFNNEKDKRMRYLQTKFETRQHEMEAKQLRQQARFHRQMNYVYLILSVSVLFALFFFIKNIRQKNKILNFEKERLTHQKEKDELTIQKLALEIDKKHRAILTHAMQISQQKEVLISVRSEIDNIIKKGEPGNIINSVVQLSSDIKTRLDLSDVWEMIKLHFEKVHPEFFTRLKNDYPHLTANDLKLCVYSKLKLTNKEIGRLLNINLASVQVSRYRLKKKMNIPEEENFDDFIDRL